jgi:putative addiction module component (TIGR02574 family)
MGLPAELLQAALALPDEERDELATRLLESFGVPPGLSATAPGFDAELRRRADALESGQDPGADWTEVRARMRAARAAR